MNYYAEGGEVTPEQESFIIKWLRKKMMPTPIMSDYRNAEIARAIDEPMPAPQEEKQSYAFGGVVEDDELNVGLPQAGDPMAETMGLQNQLLGDYTPDKRQQLIDALSQRRTSAPVVLGNALASIGDTMSRAGGAQTSFLKDSLGEQENLRNADIENFDKMRGQTINDYMIGRNVLGMKRDDAKYALDQDQLKKSQDPTSAISLGMVRAAEMADPKGAAMGIYKGKSAAEINPMLKAIEAGSTIEARRDTAEANKLFKQESRDARNEAKAERQELKDQQQKEGYTARFREKLSATTGPYSEWLSTNNALKAAQSSAQNPSPYGDVGMVYNAVKAFDPTSVVREGEIALFSGAASLKNRFQSMLTRVTKGQGLTPEQRQDIVNILSEMEKTKRNSAKSHIEPTMNQAKRMGLNLEEIDPMLSFLEEKENSSSFPQVNNQTDYEKLPPGSQYISNGKIYRKK